MVSIEGMAAVLRPQTALGCYMEGDGQPGRTYVDTDTKVGDGRHGHQGGQATRTARWTHGQRGGQATGAIRNLATHGRLAAIPRLKHVESNAIT